jgi:hypothetical protein
MMSGKTPTAGLDEAPGDRVGDADISVVGPHAVTRSAAMRTATVGIRGFMTDRVAVAGPAGARARIARPEPRSASSAGDILEAR